MGTGANNKEREKGLTCGEGLGEQTWGMEGIFIGLAYGVG